MLSKDEFLDLLAEKQHELYRDMPWRQDTRGYYVLVSELMLQQTQVERVIPKFQQFIAVFPNFEALAVAPLADVLVLWSGLGYNRRAKFLHEAAKNVVANYEGVLPEDEKSLVALPGVGPNTAGALRAYVYNLPVIFIETNIRTVLFYHFFDGDADVSDIALRQQLELLVDRKHPREFYWAMMDYGSYLKRNGVRNNQASKHYRKQSPLVGSVREVRGKIVRELTIGDESVDVLKARLDPKDGRYEQAYAQLLVEGLVTEVAGRVSLTH